MLARKMEYPANQDNLLYRLMFSNSDTDNVAGAGYGAKTLRIAQLLSLALSGSLEQVVRAETPF